MSQREGTEVTISKWDSLQCSTVLHYHHDIFFFKKMCHCYLEPVAEWGDIELRKF